MVGDPPTAVGLINGQRSKSWICMCGESVSARKFCGLRPQQQSASVASWVPAGASLDFNCHLQFKMAPCYSFILPMFSTLRTHLTSHHLSNWEGEKLCFLLMCQNTQLWNWDGNGRALGASTNVSRHHTPTGGNCWVEFTVIRPPKKKQKLHSVSRWKWKQAAHFVFRILLTPEATFEISRCFPARSGKSARTRRRSLAVESRDKTLIPREHFY